MPQQGAHSKSYFGAKGGVVMQSRICEMVCEQEGQELAKYTQFILD